MSNQLDSQEVPGEDVPPAPSSQGQKPLVYHDFPIEMSDLKADGSFEVRVIGQTPGGEMPEGVSVPANYDRQAMEIALGRLAGNRIEQAELVELGKKMAQMLLPGDVGQLFKEAMIAVRASGEGLRLQIRTDNQSLALSTLPWEFSYHERPGQGNLQNDFLALNRHISITRYFAFGPPLPSVAAKDRYRVFIGLAGPTTKGEDQLNLDGDRKAILCAVQAVKEAGIAFEPLMADPVTKIKILNAVAGSDVFHFGGHGDFAVAELDPVDGSIIRKGRLILGNQGQEIFESDDFARLLGNTTVRLVVLGACKSAESDGRNRWLGMAPALVRENIPAVVGMQFKVGDLNAAHFFAAMYRLVLDGFSVDEAIFEGRQAVSTLSGVDNRDWGTPVLYLRAKDGILFQRPPKVEPARPQHAPGISVTINVGESSGTIQPRTPLQRPPRAENFTDRENELAQLIKDLRPGRVVTLCGPGGIGKTALAAEAIWALAPGNNPPELFPDGIIFHSFYNQPQASLAMEGIARAFGEEPRPTERDAAQRVLANRNVLIGLDGAEDADDLLSVLNVCAGCGVLVTSRARKDAVADRQDISSLPLNEAEKLLKSWGGGRAKSAESVRQICELVGCLPLAVTLAGRYLAEAEMDAVDYLSWLQTTPLQALDQGKRKKESIPLLMERSLEKLSDSARQTLGVVGALALAPFGQDVVGAALKLSQGEQNKALGDLVNFGILLRRDKLYEVSHRMIYIYARSRQTVDNKIFQRMLDYYLDFTRKTVNAGRDGYARLDIERSQLMALLKACDKREELKTAIKIVSIVDEYLDLRGFWIDRVKALKIGLAASKKLEKRDDEGIFLDNLGVAYRNLGQMERAIKYHKRALSIARKIGDRQGEGNRLDNLGFVYTNLGQMDQAIKYHRKALAITKEISDLRGESTVLGNLGNAYLSLGQPEQAIIRYRQALAIAKGISYKRGAGIQLGNLGNAYFSLGKVNQAIDNFEQALAISREIGDKGNEGTWLGNLGTTYRDQGQLTKAIEYYEQALNIARDIRDRHNEGLWLSSLGLAYHELGQLEQAIDHYKRALAINQKIRSRRGEGNVLNNLGNASRELGQLKRAIEYHEQALAISREIRDRRGEENALDSLGNAYRDQGQLDRAIEYHKQALVISREINNRSGEGEALDNLGSAYRYKGQPERAIGYHEQALVISRDTGDRPAESLNLSNLGNTYRDLGQREQAIENYEQALVINREIGDQRAEGKNLVFLGRAYSDKWEVEQARIYYEQALEIARKLGDRRAEGTRLVNLGNAYIELRQEERAIEYYKQALDISREIGDRRAEGVSLANLGAAFRDLGHVQRAIENYKQALGISRQLGDQRSAATILLNLKNIYHDQGNTYRDSGQLEQAIENYERALLVSQEIGDQRAESADMRILANTYRDSGQLESAIERYEQLLAISRETGDRRGEAASKRNLGNAYRDLGNSFESLGQMERARDFWLKALSNFKEINSPEADKVQLLLDKSSE